ncbi:PorV/PorQ family protein [candidate division WOR-3 bacterium]|nr:PorV/PorQ family protein [candidate division WOR-3 bacterium]
MKKFILPLIFLPSLLLGSAGVETYDFLRIPDGARFAALGSCNMGEFGDPFALFSNPAALSGIKVRKLGFTYRRYIAGIQGGCSVYTLPFQNGILGIGVSYLNHGKILKLDEYENPVGSGEFTPQSLVPTLGYAKFIGNSAVGLALKVIYQTIDEYTSLGLATDFSYLFYPKSYPGLTIGGTLHNLGIQVMKFDEEKEKLPLFARIGGSYSLFSELLHISAEFSLPKRDFIFGAEYEISPMFTLRGGYYSWGKELKSGSGLDIFSNFSLGLGFIKKSLSVDYAITPKADLGFVNRISLIYLFPEAPKLASKVTLDKLETAKSAHESAEQKRIELETKITELEKRLSEKQEYLKKLQAELKKLEEEK